MTKNKKRLLIKINIFDQKKINKKPRETIDSIQYSMLRERKGKKGKS